VVRFLLYHALLAKVGYNNGPTVIDLDYGPSVFSQCMLLCILDAIQIIKKET